MNHDPNPRRRLGGERGATLILVAFGMIGFLGFAALAVDVGYLMVVRNQLQNAADAAALAGAMNLYTPTTGPNWADAEAQATATIPLNTATNVALTGGVVQSGYYNLSGTVPGLHSTQGAGDAPAVQVTLSKSSGNNGGPVSLFFAPVLGINSAGVSVIAVAVESYPGSVGPGQLFPTAIAQCLYDNFWDPTTGKPFTGASCPAQPSGCPLNPGNPGNVNGCEFCIGSAYHYDACQSGQWSTFKDPSNDVPTVGGLITNGNGGPLSIGDSIWIQPGTKDSLYKTAEALIGKTVVMPVVSGDLSSQGLQPITGFACLAFDASENGSGKYHPGPSRYGLQTRSGRPWRPELWGLGATDTGQVGPQAGSGSGSGRCPEP